jgi:hypothetical protein
VSYLLKSIEWDDGSNDEKAEKKKKKKKGTKEAFELVEEQKS